MQRLPIQEEPTHCGASAASSTSPATAVVDVPRYIPLPDCLYKLRRRFPAVTKCVLLECLRCRQWVPVEVFDHIPDEAETVSIHVLGESETRQQRTKPEPEGDGERKCDAASSTASHPPAAVSAPASSRFYPTITRRTAEGSDGAEGNLVMTFAQDPMHRVQAYLSDQEQVRARMFEEARRRYLWATQTATAEGTGGARAHCAPPSWEVWHSPRLREQQQQQQQPSASSPNTAAAVDRYGVALVSMAEKHFGATVLHRHTCSLGAVDGHAAATAMAAAGTAVSAAPASSLSSPSSTLSGSAAAGEASRRRGGVAKAQAPPLFIPNPAVFMCQWQRCQQADLLLDVRTECLGEIYAAAVTAKVVGASASPTAQRERGGSHHVDDGAEGNDSSFQAACDMSAQLWSSRHALNELLAKELDVRRSGRLAQRREHPCASGMGGGVGDDSNDAHHLTAARPLRLQAQQLKAAAQQLLRPTHATRTAERRVLSAFCWVVCDHCGKLRRLTQPFPGGSGAPFVCPLAAHIGACEVPEDEGVVLSAAQACVRGEEAAILHLACSQLPEPLASHCEAALHSTSDRAAPSAEGATRRGRCSAASLPPCHSHEDPLLQLVCSDAARKALGLFGNAAAPVTERPARPNGSVSAAASKGKADKEEDRTTPPRFAGDVAAEVFPALRQLAALVKKRSLGGFVRQICLPPQEIRAKREEVFRAYLSDEPGASEAPRKEDRNAVSDRGVRGGRRSSRKAEDAPEEGKETTSTARGGTRASSTRGGPSHEVSSVVPPSLSQRRRSTRVGAPAHPSAPVRRGRRVTFEVDHSSVSDGEGEPSSADDDDDDGLSSAASDEEEQVGKAARPRGCPKASGASGKGNNSCTRSGAVGASSAPRKRARQEEGHEFAGVSRPHRGAAARHAPVPSSSFPSPEPPVRRRRGRPPRAATVATPALRGAAPLSKRGRGRPATGKTRAGNSNAQAHGSGSDEEEKVFWVQCDRCDKWRILPKALPSPVKFWECKMRRGTTCSDAEDEDMPDAEDE